MPKPKNVIPTVSLHIMLPIDAYAPMQALLFSAAEARVPQGKFAEFIAARVKEYFVSRHIDLAPLIGSPPGAFFVSGTAEAIEQLTNAFKEKESV